MSVAVLSVANSWADTPAAKPVTYSFRKVDGAAQAVPVADSSAETVAEQVTRPLSIPTAEPTATVPAYSFRKIPGSTPAPVNTAPAAAPIMTPLPTAPMPVTVLPAPPRPAPMPVIIQQTPVQVYQPPEMPAMEQTVNVAPTVVPVPAVSVMPAVEMHPQGGGPILIPIQPIKQQQVPVFAFRRADEMKPAKPAPEEVRQVSGTKQPDTLPQPPADNPTLAQETLADYAIETKPPTLDRLYRLDTEAQLRKRIADETKHRPTKEADVEFPKYDRLTEDAYKARIMSGLVKQIEPNYVLYGRLYGRELNTEHFGWDMGAVQPIFSAANAFKDMAALPYNYATRPFQRWDTSAGLCYPGDPVPFLLYPPEASITGAAWESAVITAAFYIIP